MNILIVDDIDSNRRLLRAILEADGHQVAEAPDGIEALSILAVSEVDAVISDILMPRMDGFRLCQEIRAQERLRPLPFIIFTSTYKSPGDRRLAELAGADKYLIKPAPAAVILAALAEVTARERSPQGRPSEPADETLVMREYNAALVRKLEEKNRELALQTTALEAADNAVVITDARGVVVWVNPAFSALTGYAPEEILGRTPRLLKSGRHGDPFYAGLWGTILSGGTWRGELVNRRKDGSLYHGEQTITPVRLDERGVTHFIGIMHDVTERRRVEEQLRDQARLLNLAQDAIVVRDLADHVHFWNASAERLYGWSEAEAAGRGLRELLGMDEAACLAAEQTLIEDGSWSGDLQQRTKDGRRLLVSSRWSLVLDEDGRGKSVLIINTDLTEKKSLEAQFLRAQRLESIGRLAAGVAHDLSNILAPILMAAPMLRWGLTSEERENTVNLIESSARRGSQVIKQLLTVGRGIEGRRGAAQLKAIIADLAKIMHETFPKNIGLTLRIPEDLWTVSADVTQIHQVLLNLCLNARDAMPSGGELLVGAKNVVREQVAPGNPDAAPGAYVVVEVTDSGTGIPPEVLDKIFDPFFTTKEPGRGTGLGLATVLGIIRGHGGFIEVDTEPGKRSTFKVFIPATPGVAVSETGAVPRDALRGRGQLILVADDEAAFRDVVRNVLEHAGYQVLAAKDGAEAVAMFTRRQDRIKAVVCDLMMPKLDGLGVVRILKQVDPTMEILISSGMAADPGQRERIAELQSLGVKTILEKPYRDDELLAALAAMVPAPQSAADF